MIRYSGFGARALSGLVALAFVLSASTALRADDDPGITSTEVLLGGAHPFSGPASAYGALGKGAEAYFAYINDLGGVDGRKIVYKDLDDAYNPSQSIQVMRQLVEQDKVFAIFNTLGTAVNTAIRPYLNQSNVPHLFLATGAVTWGRDYEKFPWTIGFIPDYQSEAIIYARSLVEKKPNAKIGILYQNDDFGQDYITGLKKGLGDHTGAIVKEVSYEVTDPDVSSQIADLKSAGVDTVFLFATPKFAVQALVAITQQSWTPAVYLSSVSASQSVMRAATKAGGAAATSGVISSLYAMDPADPRYDNVAGMKLYKQIMAKYDPGVDASNGFYTIGMSAAYTMVQTLRAAGKNPTRKSLMDAATHINEAVNPFLLPGISVHTTPTSHFPITQLQIVRYTDGKWVPVGRLVDARPIIASEIK
jgi:branched-chain amino acid transport system substrate-binding protein